MYNGLQRLFAVVQAIVKCFVLFLSASRVYPINGKKPIFMKSATAFLSCALLIKTTNAHGVETRQCDSTDGTSINFYIKHWHGFLSTPEEAGTMTIQEGTTNVTRIPDGILNNYNATGTTDQDWGCLGGTGVIPGLVGAECNPPNLKEWVFYSYPLKCGSEVTYTLLSGNTDVLDDGTEYNFCGSDPSDPTAICYRCPSSPLYPASITSTFQDTSAPVIKIDGQIEGSYIIVPADTDYASASFSFQVTAEDCDPAPTVQVSDGGVNNYPITSGASFQASGTFPPGDTQVTVSYYLMLVLIVPVRFVILSSHTNF